ncbi:MAG TPA: hypothetical protein VKV06_08115 [Acidimicrobiales bacterium]|nr:hypothetical protein [Acidimicrobiales bacterium]
MIEEHPDPTSEAHAHVSNLVRTLVTAAAGLAEKRAQRRADQIREAQRQTEEQRQELQERVRVEQQAARLVYRHVYSNSWWDKARPQDIAQAVEAAGAWAESDSTASDALGVIEEQLQDRYGLDLEDLRRRAAEQPVAPTVERAVTSVETVRAAQAAAEAPSAERRWERQLADVAGPELAGQVATSKGWLALQRQLDHMHSRHVDVSETLREAISGRELTTANDKAATVSWRISHPHGQSRSRQASTAGPSQSAARRRALQLQQQRGATGRDNGPNTSR